MLPIVPILPIFQTTAQLVSICVSLSFVTIGWRVPSKILVGVKSMREIIIEEILTSEKLLLIESNIGFFTTISRDILKLDNNKIRERICRSDFLSAIFHP